MKLGGNVDRKQEIERRINELKLELEDVHGSPTEIYTRIVGYYRSLKNWNRGKREEYNHRVTFREYAGAGVGSAGAVRPEDRSPVGEFMMDDDGVAPDSGIQSYAYFFRESCPNCTPVKSYVENLTIDGRMVNVDTGEGMAQAIEHQILSTPTVLLMNDRGETVAQAGNVDQLRTIIESAS